MRTSSSGTEGLSRVTGLDLLRHRRGVAQCGAAQTSSHNKVEFAKALATVSAESKPLEFPARERQPVWQAFLNLLHVSNPALRLTAGMAALVLVAGTSWLAVQNIRMRSRVAALEAQGRDLRLHEQAVRQQLSEEQARAANLAAQSQKPSADNGRP